MIGRGTPSNQSNAPRPSPIARPPQRRGPSTRARGRSAGAPSRLGEPTMITYINILQRRLFAESLKSRPVCLSHGEKNLLPSRQTFPALAADDRFKANVIGDVLKLERAPVAVSGEPQEVWNVRPLHESITRRRAAGGLVSEASSWSWRSCASPREPPVRLCAQPRPRARDPSRNCASHPERSRRLACEFALVVLVHGGEAAIGFITFFCHDFSVG